MSARRSRAAKPAAQQSPPFPNSSGATANSLRVLNSQIITCRKCPRLVAYRESVARTRRRAFRSETYWGRPLPGFGDPRAPLLIIGLAPAAHGGNRTGRMFTGDRSGDFLYARLHEAGFANQSISSHRDDGLRLSGAYITATARCAPPENKPSPEEIGNCRSYLEAELELLRPRAVLALGKIAFDGYLKLLRDRGTLGRDARFTFRHGASYLLPAHSRGHAVRLFAAYHPSQQNTQTGRVTAAMYRKLLRQIRRFLDG
ncbi:MAG TPA: uracil-DNA glycosylase [Candidatus Acidoferrales bacterium]|nr:uracil-DNA glycosylase [Candidatus Acidoferrales bacterium]